MHIHIIEEMMFAFLPYAAFRWEFIDNIIDKKVAFVNEISPIPE